KGKCRHCHVPISKIYPITEFSVGLLFMFAAYEMETNDLVISLTLISLLTLATITDIHYFIIPNKLLSFFMGLFIIIRVLYPLDTWYESLLGFLISYLLILLLIIIINLGMYVCDIKFLAVTCFFIL